MNLEEALDKVTAPPAKASEVYRFTREEIDHLQTTGQVTPLGEIPRFHMCGREIVPLVCGRRSYGYGA